ncbi:Entericidin EcnA/B family protein [Sphingomonas laterariae]|uniref:Entericidin EcnA/B family protein n=1 Tax=Edaphosphingomonas laterariae TaxID=861865 RepID=A0A239E5A2_9SPHN|nr:Entericidin EcnA/B family protein [Sphingomonas laterariae]
MQTIKTMRALMIFACLGGLAACNTVEGMGRDVQSVGKTVERAAN